ncbi:P-type conjugative transfer protein TrbL [Enterobacter ludwigii]
MNIKKLASWSFFLGAFLCLLSTSAFAADVPQNNTLDSIIQQFQSQTKTWEPIIHHLTLSLFWGLAIISFTWTFIQLVLKEGTGLVDILAELTRRTMLIGFSVWMMNEAPDLARSLINSFVYAGTKISGGAVAFSPSNVFELGINVITIAWKGTSMWEPVQTLALFLCVLIILICFAMMAMEMTILIVSGYIIVSGGIIAMGFLGSDWTRDNAINYFTAVLGVAFKMFIMQLVYIVGYSFIQDWGTSINADTPTVDYLVMLGSCIVFAGLMREIPQMAASLASGRFTMQGGGLASVAGGIAGAAAGVAGAGVAMGAGSALMKDAMNAGSEGGSSENSASSPEITRAIDTGPGDDGKAFAAQAQASGGSTRSQSSTGGENTRSDTGSPGESTSDSRSGNAVSAPRHTKADARKAVKTAALQSIAARHALGAVLARGAKALNEKPVDIDTASAAEINRQLHAAAEPPDTASRSSAAQQEADDIYADQHDHHHFNDNIGPDRDK